MNGQERFIKCLKCEEVDHLPSFWMGYDTTGLFAKEFHQFLDQEDNPEIDACFEVTKLGDMTLHNWFAKGTSTIISVGGTGRPYPIIYYNRKEDRFYTKEEAKHLPDRKKNYKISAYGQIRHIAEKIGGWYYGPYFTGDEPLERMNELYAEFGAPWEIDPVDNTRSISRNIEIASEIDFPHAIKGSAPNVFEGMYGGFGPISFARLMRKKPGNFKDIIKKYTKCSLDIEKISLDAGHEIIQTGDDLGQKDRALISPKDYDEFFKPTLKARCDLAHKHSAAVYMHSCGFLEELIPSFMDAGLDGLQSLEVPAGNDLNRIRNVVKDKMCLIGGIDTSRILSFGTPGECTHHVKSQIDAATNFDGEKLNGGYIPGPSHKLLDVPLENVKAVIDAIQKFGEK